MGLRLTRSQITRTIAHYRRRAREATNPDDAKKYTNLANELAKTVNNRTPKKKNQSLQVHTQNHRTPKLLEILSGKANQNAEKSPETAISLVPKRKIVPQYPEWLAVQCLELPISENQIYVNHPKGRVYSDLARQYRSRFFQFARSFPQQFEMVGKYLASSMAAELVVYLGFSHNRIFSRSGGRKMIDGPNFLKLLLDTFATATDVDDSIWFDVRVVKYAVPEGSDEICFLLLRPMPLPDAAEIRGLINEHFCQKPVI